MLLNKENLLKMLREYVKQRPVSTYTVMIWWADFIDWLDLHAVEHSMQTDVGRDTDLQQYTIFKRCPYCVGTGGVETDNELLEKCPLCNGTGQILVKEINPHPAPRG